MTQETNRPDRLGKPIKRRKVFFMGGFDPDRYDDGACKEALRNAYFPFSLGPRICTEAGFAKQEAMIVLSSLIRNYRFEAVPEHVPIPIGRLTVCSENGIRLRVFRR